MSAAAVACKGPRPLCSELLRDPIWTRLVLVSTPDVLTVPSQLSKYPALNNFEKQTSVPKVYAILGLAALYFFLVFFNIAGEFLVNVAAFILPGYYSLAALFSARKTDDTQVRSF